MRSSSPFQKWLLLFAFIAILAGGAALLGARTIFVSFAFLFGILAVAGVLFAFGGFALSKNVG